MSFRLSRLLAASALGLLSLGLAGCQAPTPSVTWFGNGSAADVGPKVFCELNSSLAFDCSQVDGPTASLTLHDTDPVQINIPAEVARAPWWLVISYADDAASYRTPLDTTGKTLSYTVVPTPGHQLKQIDLQVPTVTADTNGNPQWTPYQLWVLSIEPSAPTGADPATPTSAG